MDLKTKAIWLKGYLESLSHSDNVSKRQIQILINEMEELISFIDDEDEGNEYYSSETSFNDEGAEDDLPF